MNYDKTVHTTKWAISAGYYQISPSARYHGISGRPAATGHRRRALHNGRPHSSRNLYAKGQTEGANAAPPAAGELRPGPGCSGGEQRAGNTGADQSPRSAGLSGAAISAQSSPPPPPPPPVNERRSAEPRVSLLTAAINVTDTSRRLQHCHTAAPRRRMCAWRPSDGPFWIEPAAGGGGGGGAGAAR